MVNPNTFKKTLTIVEKPKEINNQAMAYVNENSSKNNGKTNKPST